MRPFFILAINWLCAIVLVISLSDCARHSMPAVMQSAQSAQPAQRNTLRSPAKNDAVISNGGRLATFADAQGLLLTTDADFGRFIDPEVTGSDRTLLIALMRAIPPGMRGNVTVISPGGHVIANQVSLISQIKFMTQAGAGSIPSPNLPNRVHAMSYPPTGGSGGPYIRWYSQQSMNAMYGYATFPCDSV